MHSWCSVRQLLALSPPRLRGPATRRLQQRRQQLLQQQSEQRTPTPKSTASASAGASSKHLAWNELQQQQQQQKHQGPPRRVGAGLFADPMRPPEAVEGGNAAHTQFIKMHREEMQQRVVQQLILLRKQRQQQQLQQDKDAARNEERDVHAAAASPEAAPELPLALAEVYVHHEHSVHQLAPRPHAFVEARVKDLIAGASAAANPLYPPSVPLEVDGGLGPPEGGATRGPSEAQLRKVAALVKAPGMDLLHAETDAALSQLTGSPEGPPGRPSQSAPDFKSLPVAPKASEAHPSDWGEFQGKPFSSSRRKPDAPSLVDGAVALEPWEVHGGSLGPQGPEGAPSLVLAAASRQMRAELRARGHYDEDAETRGAPPVGDIFPVAESKLSIGRSRRQRYTVEAELAEAAAAPFWQETRKATAQAAMAREALLADTGPRGSDKAPLRATPPREAPATPPPPFRDAFADSKETKGHPQLSALWETHGARCAIVRDCSVPVDFIRQ